MTHDLLRIAEPNNYRYRVWVCTCGYRTKSRDQFWRHATPEREDSR